MEQKKCLTTLIALCFLVFNIKAQIWKKISEGIDEGTKIIYKLAVLTKLTGMTTAEFNSTVKVIKGNETNTLGGSSGKITKPKIKRGEFQNLSWEPVTYFDGHLFPSCIISMATYKGELEGEMKALSSPVGFRLKSKYSNMPIKWEVECVDNKFFERKAGEITYTNADQDVFFMPEVSWNYDILGKQQSSTPLNIIFRLFDDEGNKVEKVVPVYIRSINDCIFRYKDNKLDFQFTAFIQEEHPEIDKILKEALNTKTIDMIAGYQLGTDSSVHKQVQAIWQVLHDRGFQYSSITKTAGISNSIYSQVVRTFDNAIKTNQANCVDGTVVFASILRKIGIHSVLVLTSDHCFLGYYTDINRRNISFLETTLLSNSELIDEAKNASEKKIAYYKQFLYASLIGMEKFKSYKAKNDLLEIDVDASRKLVRPIPFQ